MNKFKTVKVNIDRDLLIEELAKLICKRSLRYFSASGGYPGRVPQNSYRHAAKELVCMAEILSGDDALGGANGNHSAGTWLSILGEFKDVEPIINRLIDSAATNKGEV